MKKLIAIATLLALVLSCTGCSEEQPTLENYYMNVAATVGEYQITSVEAGYFFVDVINKWYNQYGAQAEYYGLDINMDLNRQICDSKTNDTWAQYFLDMTLDNIEDSYVLYHAAKSAGYHLTEQEQSDVAMMYENFSSYAADAGFSTVDAYLQSMYGEGASESTYKSYFETTLLARFYYSHYSSALLDSYTTEDLRAYEGDTPYDYDSFTYANYYLPASLFDSQLALNTAANQIASKENTTVEKLNKAISEATKDKLKEGETAVCAENKRVRYSQIEKELQQWLLDDSRSPGDITAIPVYPDDSTMPTGYQIVLFQNRSDNYITMVNTRHILIPYEGGTTDSLTGETTYSDAEKATAREQAEQLLEQWKQGEANGETFGQLADEHSADNAPGGLYEDIVPGEMFAEFDAWLFDENRSINDTAIISTDYGVHITYFVGWSDWNYRDYMVANDKLNSELTEWEESLHKGMELQKKDTVRIDMTQSVKDILY